MAQIEEYKLDKKGVLEISGTAEFQMKATKIMCETELAKKKKELAIWQARLDYINENEA